MILSACTEEDFAFGGQTGDKEVWVKLNFGHRDFEQVKIETRATLSEIAESRVENLFVYVFDSLGKRLYSHYYDYTNRVETLPNATCFYWTVSNRTSANEHDTQGEVMIKSHEEIYTFDAHYGQRVFRIDTESLLDNTITWYVKTPFSEGAPEMESDTEVPNLDYKWVWFMLNDVNSDGSYSVNNQWYPGDRYRDVAVSANYKLINVVEFVQLIREEKLKFDNASEIDKATVSAFKPDGNGKYCIYVTRKRLYHNCQWQ